MPACGYDLSGIAAESGDCPECGLSYSQKRLQARTQALILWSLALIGFGGLLALAGEAVAESYAYLPRAIEGTGGGGQKAANQL